MTIKHRKNNVSAENEYVLKDATFNPQNMTLTITKKNLFTGENVESELIKFNDFKLRIIKKTQNEINELKASTNADDIKLRESHLFLVPLDNDDSNDIDEYRELIWSTTKNDFEEVGTTRIYLEPIQLEINKIKNVLNIETTTQNGEDVFSSVRLKNIEDTLDSKITMEDVSDFAKKTDLNSYAEKNSLSNVAFDGKYDSLNNKPDIPTVTNVVENGNQNAVSSDAVFNSLPNTLETFEIVYMDGSTRTVNIYIQGS